MKQFLVDSPVFTNYRLWAIAFLGCWSWWGGGVQASKLDSLKAVVDSQPNNEGTIISWMDALQHAGEFRVLDSITSGYANQEGFSDSFYANIGYAKGYLSVVNGMPFRVILNRFQRVVRDIEYLGSNDKKGDVYYHLGYSYHNLNINDSAVFFYNKALAYFIESENKKRSNRIIVNLSNISIYRGQYKWARNALDSIRKNIIEISDCNDVQYYYNAYGSLYNEMGLHDSAIHYCLKALRSAEECEQYLNMGVYYTNMSNTFRNTLNFEKALKYARKGMHYIRLSTDERFIAVAHIALSEAMMGLGMLDSAIWHTRQVLKDTQRPQRDQGFGQLALCFAQKEEFDTAVYYFKESLLEKRKLNITNGKQVCFIGLANAYTRLGKYGKSKLYLDSAFNQITITGDPRYLADYYQALGVYLTYLGKPQEAVEAYQKNEYYRDSVLNAERDARIDGLRILYEVEQKQAKIKALNQQNLINTLQLNEQKAKAKTQSIVIAVSILLLVLLALGLVVQQRYANRFKLLNQQLVATNAIVEKKSQQLDLVNKEIYHRTINHMQTMASIMGLQKDRLSDGDGKSVLAENELRLNAMGLIHKKLFKHDPFTKINLQNFATDLMEDLAFAYDVGSNFKYKVDLESITVKPDTLIPISLVLNECFSNSFKYAFDNQKKPILTVTGTLENNMFSVTVQDNGPGFPISEEEGQPTGFGLELMRNMAIQLEGSVTFHNNNGAQILFKFLA